MLLVYVISVMLYLYLCIQPMHAMHKAYCLIIAFYITPHKLKILETLYGDHSMLLVRNKDGLTIMICYTGTHIDRVKLL